MESLFGLNQNAETLHFNPCLPTHWPEAELNLNRGGLQMRFVFLRCGVDAARIAMAQRDAEGVQAVVLMPREELAWAALAGPHQFVVPLL